MEMCFVALCMGGMIHENGSMLIHIRWVRTHFWPITRLEVGVAGEGSMEAIYSIFSNSLCFTYIDTHYEVIQKVKA